MTNPADDAHANLVPLVVVDDKGRRRTASPHPDETGVDVPTNETPDAPAEVGLDELAGLAATAAVAAGAQALRVMSVSLRIAGTVLERATSGTAGQTTKRTLRSLLDRPAEDGRQDLTEATRRIEARVARIFGVVIPMVVETLDVELVLDRLDPNQVIERIDLDALLARIDVNALLDRVDVARLLDQVDVDALIDRIDVDALMDRVDVDALVARARIEEIIARSTGHMADSALDLGRRQAVGVDAVIMRLVDRVLGRDPEQMPTGPVALVDEDQEDAP